MGQASSARGEEEILRKEGNDALREVKRDHCGTGPGTLDFWKKRRCDKAHSETAKKTRERKKGGKVWGKTHRKERQDSQIEVRHP